MAEEIALVLTNVVSDDFVYDISIGDTADDTFGRTQGRTWKFDCYTDPGYLDGMASFKPAKPWMAKAKCTADCRRDYPVDYHGDYTDAYLGGLEVVVQSGTVIDGNFRFDRPVCIKGKLIGNLNSSELVVIGFNAEICGQVRAKNLIVIGSLIGKASVEEMLVIKSTGYVDGEVKVSSLISEENATFCGHASLNLGH